MKSLKNHKENFCSERPGRNGILFKIYPLKIPETYIFNNFLSGNAGKYFQINTQFVLQAKLKKPTFSTYIPHNYNIRSFYMAHIMNHMNVGTPFFRISRKKLKFL